MDLSNVQIETDRLRLTPVSEQDLQQIFLEFRLPMTKYMNYTSAGSMEELHERYKNWQKELKQGITLFMVATLKESGEFLGCFALEEMNQENPEMGGWLKKSAHGHGYGREAAAALKQWAEENLEYGHIVWPCAKENIASCKLAESLGGKIHREYEKKMASGNIWLAREYWISKNNIGLGGERDLISSISK